MNEGSFGSPLATQATLATKTEPSHLLPAPQRLERETWCHVPFLAPLERDPAPCCVLVPILSRICEAGAFGHLLRPFTTFLGMYPRPTRRFIHTSASCLPFTPDGICAVVLLFGKVLYSSTHVAGSGDERIAPPILSPTPPPQPGPSSWLHEPPGPGIQKIRVGPPDKERIKKPDIIFAVLL